MPILRSGNDTASRPERTPRSRRRSQSISTRNGGTQGYWKKSINDQHPNQANAKIISETSMEIDLQAKTPNVIQQNADGRSDFADQNLAQQDPNKVINTNAIGSNTSSSNTNHPDIEISHWEEEFDTMSVTTRIGGTIQLELIPGATLKEKINFVKHIIMEFPEFLSVNTAIIDGKKLVKITLANIQGFDKCATALAKEKIILEHLVKPSAEEIAATRDIKSRRKILVKDISADTSHIAIRSIFETFGTIVACRTTIHGPWKVAEIEYTTEDEAANVCELKAIPIQRDISRIYPWNEVDFIDELRKNLTLRLTNLPYGTTGFDIWNYVRSVGGTTCFIPKSYIKMARRRHAYITFNDLDTKEAIENKQINIKGYIAQWLDPEIRTCFICEEAGHLAAECHWKKEKQVTVKNNKKLATKYNQMGISPKEVPKQIASLMTQLTPTRSYASVAKNSLPISIKSGKTPENNASQIHSTFAQQVESKFKDMEKRFDKLEAAINKLTIIISKGTFEKEPLQPPRTPQAQGKSELASVLSPENISNMHFSNFSSPIAMSSPAIALEFESEHARKSQFNYNIPTMAPLQNDAEFLALQNRYNKLEQMVEQLMLQLNVRLSDTDKDNSISNQLL
jgi:hypothetical protein